MLTYETIYIILIMSYDQQALIARFYLKCSALKSANTTGLVQPLTKVENRKTQMSNFGVVCESFKRPLAHVKNFVEEEINSVKTENDRRVDVSLSSANVLIVSGNFKQNYMEGVIRRYIKRYVQCQSCKQMDTLHIKENRVEYIQCNKCKCKKPVEH
jgi:translation initiation factor 2 beta subunit (eIF-2beta)/eIF-5